MAGRERELPQTQREEEFVPRGAIAFTVIMVLAYGLIWFSLFFLMAGRS